MNLGAEERARLLQLARESIRHGLEHGRPLTAGAEVSGALAQPGACFVSLHLGAELRGCIGRTEASPRLVDPLLDNAWAAAFRDPRFEPLRPEELDALSLEVHVLSPMRPLPFTSPDDLYRHLRVGVDGLQVECGGRRGVFLPVMWEQLPEPREFVRQLLRKAAIRDSEPFTASRFEAQLIR
jgi:AmmeMemoRadiSam system protein A